MGRPCFRIKRVPKVLNSFLFAKPDRHYAKVLNFALEICGVKYFHTVSHGQAASFSEKNGFIIERINTFRLE